MQIFQVFETYALAFEKKKAEPVFLRHQEWAPEANHFFLTELCQQPASGQCYLGSSPSYALYNMAA